MKKIILIIILFSSIESKSQVIYNNITNLGYTNEFIYQSNLRCISKYDTTILNKGLESCKHDWAIKDNPNGYMGIGKNVSCLVNHGITGCPDEWENYNIICTVCLKHLNISEKRIAEKIVNKYDEALERLNKLKH